MQEMLSYIYCVCKHYEHINVYKAWSHNLLELKPAVAGADAPLRVGGDFKRVASPVNQI